MNNVSLITKGGWLAIFQLITLLAYRHNSAAKRCCPSQLGLLSSRAGIGRSRPDSSDTIQYHTVSYSTIPPCSTILPYSTVQYKRKGFFYNRYFITVLSFKPVKCPPKECTASNSLIFFLGYKCLINQAIIYVKKKLIIEF